MATTKPISTVYKTFFLVLDPMIAIWGAYMNLFTPAVSVDAFIPAATAPYNPLQSFLCHQIAGALLMCAVLDIFLLRKTNEIWIWKAQQSAQLLYDIVIIWSMWYSLRQQGRLRFESLRQEDWGTFGITATCGLMRALFCAEIGLPPRDSKVRRD